MLQRFRRTLKKIVPLFVFALATWYVLNFIPAPSSWQEASVWEILILYIPLLGFFTFFVRLFISSTQVSFVIGLGLIMLATFQAQKALNLISAIGTVIFVIAVIVLLRRLKLTKKFNIPKLDLTKKESKK